MSKSTMAEMADAFDAKVLGLALAKTVGGAVLGKGAAMIFEVLADLLGLVKDDMKQYFEQLQAQMTAIQGTQVEMKQMLQSILRAQTELKSQIEDATLRTAWQRVSTNKNVIAVNYESLTRSVADVPNDPKRASEEIYQVLTLSNINRIDEAMRNIHDEVYGQAEAKGIIAMQEGACRMWLVSWIKNPANLETGNWGERSGWFKDWFPNYANNRAFLDDGFNQSFPDALENAVLPTFRVLLGIQLQGLVLMNLAWANTSQAARLALHVENIRSQIREMAAFHGKMIAKADEFAQEVFSTYAPALPQYLREMWSDGWHYLGEGEGEEPHYGRDQIRANKFIACPFTDEWKCWPIGLGYKGGSVPNSYHDGRSYIVKTPLAFDGRDKFVEIIAKGPYYYARRAVCYNKGSEFTGSVPQPSKHINLRISESDWAGLLPQLRDVDWLAQHPAASPEELARQAHAEMMEPVRAAELTLMKIPKTDKALLARGATAMAKGGYGPADTRRALRANVTSAREDEMDEALFAAYPTRKLPHSSMVSVESGMFNFDGSRAVSTDSGGALGLWNAKEGKAVRWLQSPRSGLRVWPVFSRDGRRLAFYAANGLMLVDAQTGGDLIGGVGIREYLSTVQLAKFTPRLDDRRILIAYGNVAEIVDETGDNIFLRNEKGEPLSDPASGMLRTLRTQHGGQVLAAGFNPDGTAVVSASADTTARIWDAQTAATLGVLAHDSFVDDAFFCGSGGRIATVGDRKLRLWDAKSFKEVVKLEQNADCALAASSSDVRRERIYVRTGTKAARVWETSTGKLLVSIPVGGQNFNADLSPDSAFIATHVDDSSEARVWNVENGKPELILKHENAVRGVAFSPDGLLILTYGHTDARLWDASTGNLIQHVEHKAPVNAAVFSGDGRQLITACGGAGWPEAYALLWTVGY